MSFGEELRRHRQERGLSLRSCAARMYLSSGYLSKIENGTKPPTSVVADAADQVFQTAGRFRLLATQAAAMATATGAPGTGPRLARNSSSANAPSRIHRATPSELEVLAMAADRAQRFTLSLPGTADVTVEQIADGVHDLALAYPTRPLPELLTHIIAAQDSIFGLLERPQRPTHGRQLYFLSSIVCGMLAKASHDLGDPSAALTQTRTAFLCADQTRIRE